VVTDINVLSAVTQSIGSLVLSNVVPYLETEIDAVHFVQSPYVDHSVLLDGIGKELVFTHPKHTPKRLRLNVSTYVFESIFTNDATQYYDQFDWSVNGYPATCGSFLGRLVLAGSTEGSAAAANGSSSETVWMTEVGDWSKFTDPASTQVLPTDSIVFTAIYRSPIKWVAGQKELLIGAGEMEYTASADGIFQPADLGVAMHSTHGSNAVQAVTMGASVMFPSESGSKMRSMQFANDAGGWVAPDMTIAHPSILSTGVRRMVRMRNPHQMVAVLCGNGNIALFHTDTATGTYAWSRIVLSGYILDIVALPDGNGVDNLHMLVNRTINGVPKIYLESLTRWNAKNESSQVYMQSYLSNLAVSPSNVVTGLGHLEGRYVQVVTDGNFLGKSYLVTGGQITLTNQIGEAINYVSIYVGLPMACTMTTLPVIGSEPGSTKRFVDLTVRTLGSTRPTVNGEQPADREPLKNFGRSQGLDIIYDNEILQLGDGATVVVSDSSPFRLEVIGVFGTIKDSSI
jgi:hypothetical protein